MWNNPQKKKRYRYLCQVGMQISIKWGIFGGENKKKNVDYLLDRTLELSYQKGLSFIK